MLEIEVSGCEDEILSLMALEVPLLLLYLSNG